MEAVAQQLPESGAAVACSVGAASNCQPAFTCKITHMETIKKTSERKVVFMIHGELQYLKEFINNRIGY